MEQDLVIGVTANKILSRFSPAAHYANISQQAQIYGYTMYTDPFPGGWFPAGYGIAGLEDGSVSGEILRRAMLCDSIEYRNGQAHFYIYNVSDTSATYAIEISTIQTTQDIDNPERLQIYYYDIGEPILGEEAGEFLQLEAGDKLQFTRADYQDDPDSISNHVDTSTFGTLESDNNVYDGVTVIAGETLSFYGVTAPIQNTPEQIHQNPVGNYSLDNYVSEVEYTFIFENGLSMTQTESVGLTRVTDGRVLPSILEFKHDISVSSQWTEQIIVVQVQGYDAFGNTVLGAYEEFELTVTNEMSIAA